MNVWHEYCPAETPITPKKIGDTKTVLAILTQTLKFLMVWVSWLSGTYLNFTRHNIKKRDRQTDKSQTVSPVYTRVMKSRDVIAVPTGTYVTAHVHTAKRKNRD